MSGCLPLLIQFPILFGVINVVYNPLTHIVRLSKDVIAQAQTIAQGDDNQAGSYLRAFGDATMAAYGNNILVMACAGDMIYGGGTASNPNRRARIYSTDNGATWHI